jgi:predicted alpha/beta hydrolase family esterase
MRTSDCDILIIPGFEGSGPDHWQSRWERKLSTARRVEQDSWDVPDRDAWTHRIVEAVEAAQRPVVLVAHSLGVVAVAHAAPLLPAGRVRGAFLVGLPDVERTDFPSVIDRTFAPLPRGHLPFPAVLVTSRTDPYCDIETASAVAHDWGAVPVDAGDSGHINTESGHGPWPEGLMRFAGFLKRL